MIKKHELLVGAALGTVAYLFIGGHGPSILPILFLAGLLYAVFTTTGLKGVGRRFATVGAARPSGTVTFDDVGGQATAKKELLEALDFLHHAEGVRRLGIRPLKGILLCGPPGTGKTLLAKAAAGYTNSAFLTASGSEFIEMYAGVGAQRVRELFKAARERAGREKRSTAIIFIDEIEVLGGKRGRHSSHLEYDQTLNQLLVEMDGIVEVGGVRTLIIGATNREDLLDEALLRPGRFDRVVQVQLPDRAGRRHILDLHTREKPLGDDADIDVIARETFGFSGAHLESLANEAAILAMRQGRSDISQANLLEAVDKVMLGEKLDRRPDDEELRRVAVHEIGHALIGEFLRPGSVSGITISPRGSALGYVRNRPQKDQYLYTQEQLEDEISMCLAGSVAEKLVLGSKSTGAANDIEKAVQLAEQMVFAGMSRLGVVSRQTLPERTLDRSLREIIDRLEQHVMGLLTPRIDLLAALAGRLVEEEKLSGDQLRTLLVDEDPDHRITASLAAQTSSVIRSADR